MTDLLNRDVRELTGVWTLDPSHTSVEFSVRHMMVATVRGRMAVRCGELRIDESAVPARSRAADPARSSVTVEMDTASIDTGNADRDKHLRSPDFLDVERFPTMTFRSVSVDARRHPRTQGAEADGELIVQGDLTVRDVTRVVTLEAQIGGVIQDPFGNLRMGFSASAVIDRKEFGLTWNAALEGGGAIVGDKVKVAIDAEFTHPLG